MCVCAFTFESKLKWTIWLPTAWRKKQIIERIFQQIFQTYYYIIICENEFQLLFWEKLDCYLFSNCNRSKNGISKNSFPTILIAIKLVQWFYFLFFMCKIYACSSRSFHRNSIIATMIIIRKFMQMSKLKFSSESFY